MSCGVSPERNPWSAWLGNHEHWKSVLGERLPEAREAAKACGGTLLQGNAVTLHGCRFVGTALLRPKGPVLDTQALQGLHETSDFN